MATIGLLVELLRKESWAAKAAGEQATGERLWELAEDPGDMTPGEVAWIEQATDEHHILSLPIAHTKLRDLTPAAKPRRLTAADVIAILNVMPEEWRAFFTLLAQTGVRIGELLGLTWGSVHLGDDPHIMVTEQVYLVRVQAGPLDRAPARTGALPFSGRT